MRPPTSTRPWIAAGVSLFVTCGDDAHHVEFIVHVNRIEAPLWVAADQSFEVILHGTLGPNGCHRVGRLESLRHADRIEITVYGERIVARRTVACADEIPVLEERVVIHPPFEPGTFAVVVHQPNGRTTRHLVHVRE